MTRIGSLFERTRAQRRPALIMYLTAGDPSPELTVDLVLALERGGADLIELGVPFSDPVADGPVIQRASDRALRAGMTLQGVLDVASRIRERSEIPLLLFTYLNPVMRYGFGSLAKDAVSAGIDGCLVTDLAVDEAPAHVNAARSAGLDTVFLVAPTSTDRRLRLVAEYSSGFIYLVSRAGVTGERSALSRSGPELVSRLRTMTDMPVALGFGISTPEQVREAGSVADGVVIGSALVRTIEDHAASPALCERVQSFTRTMADGLAVGAAQ